MKISPGISLEGMMLKLKVQYFGHLIRRVDSLEKTLMLGGIGLPAILIPACASSSPAFLMMYSAYKLNKQGDNIQP